MEERETEERERETERGEIIVKFLVNFSIFPLYDKQKPPRKWVKILIKKAPIFTIPIKAHVGCNIDTHW